MSRPVLYLDCSSGISGDMTVAALLDLGADCSVLSDALASLPLSGYYVEIRDTFKSGIRACDFNVILENDNHDHDMEYLHGHSHDSNVPPDAPHDHHGTPDAPHGRSHDTPDAPHDHSHGTPDAPYDHSHGTPDTPHDHSHGTPGTPRSHVPENIPDVEPHIHEPAHVHDHTHALDHTLAHEPAHVHDQPHTHEPAHIHDQPHTHEYAPIHDHVHTHDPAHVHEQPHTLESAHVHDQPHTHDHAPMHDHAHTHDHTARNLHDITEIIRAGCLTESARELALRIFHILAKAEASVHGKSIDEVHFHEVGAVDSIVDIVAAAVCLDNLQPEYVVISPLTDGTGQIRCQHGLIPVPVPAVAAIAEQNQLVLKIANIEGELVTPTGAAIAAALQSGRRLPAEFRIVGTGFGAGKRDYAASGLLRAMLVEPVRDTEFESAARISGTSDFVVGTPNVQSKSEAPAEISGSPEGISETAGSASGTPGAQSKSGSPAEISGSPTEMSGSADPEGTILSLETNIDDCSGEALAFTMQSLLDNGALDVFYTPIYMKKNRPAYLLRVLCRAEDRTVMESIIFRNTTTIGIRFQEVQRTRLPRRIVTVETPWGTADVKCCAFEGNTFFYPESDSVSRLARAHQIGFHEMYHLVQDYAYRNIT